MTTQDASYVFSSNGYANLPARIAAGEWDSPEALATWMEAEVDDYTTDPDEGSEPVEVLGIEAHAERLWLDHAPWDGTLTIVGRSIMTIPADHPLKQMNETPMEQLRFRDFADLGVPGGRDKFTSMRLASLQDTLNPRLRAWVESQLPDAKHQAAAYRWYLRGLLPDRAVRKVRTDLEVSQNAMDTKRRWRRENSSLAASRGQ